MKVIGIIGGGQLARMMYQAAIPLGLEISLLAEEADGSAAQVVPNVATGDYTDRQTVVDFASTCDVITFDHEHVPTAILEEIDATGVHVFPPPSALVHAQDKLVMRRRLSDLGIPCPSWRECETAADLIAFGDEIGWPIIAKVARGGYDGHGVWKLDGPEEVAVPFAHQALSGDPTRVFAEEFIDLARELSVIVVRGQDGAARTYPISETVQDNGMCVETVTPCPDLSVEQAEQVNRFAVQLAAELGVVGLLAIELMQRSDGEIVVNELAMRPHNTGHWTIDGAVTSQFENHLRAVAGLPLGDTSARNPWVVMKNVIGTDQTEFAAGLIHALAADPAAKVHWYGKGVRAGRKLGHVTTFGDELESTRSRANRCAAELMGAEND